MNDLVNNSNLFKDAILYTSNRTGFPAGLVEKDYFCSLILNYFFSFDDTALVFKGGTCLSKVYTDFYRMSEDLDFTIPTPLGSSRAFRRSSIKKFKQRFSDIEKKLPVLMISKEPYGANVSTQYLAEVNYVSVISGNIGKIKIEVGLREPILDKVVEKEAKTLLFNPFTEKPAVLPVPIKCFSIEELYAEKTRAALTRLNPAIRDIYDIDYAVQNNLIDLFNKNLRNFLQYKLAVKGTGKIDVSESKKQELLIQTGTELKPVLRKKDYDNFNFDRAFSLLLQVCNIESDTDFTNILTTDEHR
jgi:predicted nucleotidyltransferase component of viral defense system